ncbi:argininosuccinate lyase [Suttonella sp. R2A3]|uniref:argininosuccinate lyase n=1 Tax=Suttonella sp. R2A3 TaxID=2908648 RepID=UPI001F321422|nr:argininosuccinate lyase [Suttonella sp. R2A3]UJF24698.1 argininosuccinate lyase [Suttonella sp. R2A3]
MSEHTTNSAWGGRFQESTDAFVAAFTASVDFDQQMAQEDIDGSLAHAAMLVKQGILSEEEGAQIRSGLEQVRSEIAAGTFAWSVALEDVHMNIEQRLTALIGITGKKLHTGRSRNDQVATDLRLFLRSQIDEISAELVRLQQGLLDVAEREATTIMPGFTHLQVAQPITFGHHLLAWFEMLKRDFERLQDCRKRLNQSPLGAAALAGTTYPIDREYSAQLLGFDGVCQNSLDAVSDRDFTIEFCAAASITMMHLSRFCEELILWNSSAFAFVDIPDRFCTGSSIMPQKKNPDVPELVRGKTGRVYGHLFSLLTLMKGQPLAYNKDNQEDKEPVFDTITTLRHCLRAFADMVPMLETNAENMLRAAAQGFSTATDLADYLVGKGVAFRDAHEVVGKSVRLAIDRGCDLADLPLADLQALCELIEEDVYESLLLEGSVAARNHIGGTAPEQVRAQVKKQRSQLAS